MVLNREIRVNTRREKKALESLSLALSLVGLSLEDLSALSDVVAENRRLKASNASLTERLDKATGGQPHAKDDPKVLDYLKGVPTIDRPAGRKEGA